MPASSSGDSNRSGNCAGDARDYQLRHCLTESHLLLLTPASRLSNWLSTSALATQPRSCDIPGRDE
jgi:hypothetical protein